MIYLTEHPDETRRIGRKVASTMKGGEVLCLYGDLGSGKTTFMDGFIKFFLPGKRVLSPTFIIVRHYFIKLINIHNILHADLYRISETDDVSVLGLSEFLNIKDSIVAIEWAEKLGKKIPAKRIDIKFNILSDDRRKITYTKV